MGPTQVIIQKGLEEYFFQQVRSACLNQHLEASDHTEYYLVRLLSDFCRRETLYPKNWETDRPLAIQYLEIFQLGIMERIPLLKSLGDCTLYITGFFQESLNRSGLDINYYFSLGGNAYRKLHAIADQTQMLEVFQETFAELSERFPAFAEVLCEISENSEICRDTDLLKLYERWLVTGSKRILKKLHLAGIYPTLQEPSNIAH